MIHRNNCSGCHFHEPIWLLLFLPRSCHSSYPTIFRLFCCFPTWDLEDNLIQNLVDLKLGYVVLLPVLLQCLLCLRMNLVLHLMDHLSIAILQISINSLNPNRYHIDASMRSFFSIEPKQLPQGHPIHHVELPLDLQFVHLMSLNLSGTAHSIYHYGCAGWSLEYDTGCWACNLIMQGQKGSQRDKVHT